MLDATSLRHRQNPFDFSRKSIDEEDLSLGSSRTIRVSVAPAPLDSAFAEPLPNAISMFGGESKGTREALCGKRFSQMKTQSARLSKSKSLDPKIVTALDNVSKKEDWKVKMIPKRRISVSLTPKTQQSGDLEEASKNCISEKRQSGKIILEEGNLGSLFSEKSSGKNLESPLTISDKKKLRLSHFGRKVKKTLRKKSKFRKIFDPKKFYASLQGSPESEELREKFNIFLLLPQLLFLNNLQKEAQAELKVESRSYESRRKGQSKGSSERCTNVSLSTSQKQTTKSKGITDNQKQCKIAKKLRRAWSLNQQISMNIFKKQVRFFDPRREESSLLSETLARQNFGESDVFGMKRARRATLQRRSKLEAKNKIKNSMMRQRKQRAPLGEEREHLEYKRLVGLKRDLGEFLEGADRGKVDSAERRKKKAKATQGNFQYVEFLDFSFKNINKSNFLAVGVGRN